VAGDQPPRGTVPGETGSLGPCPACGGPLFPWVEAHAYDARRDEEYLLDRCEGCGSGVARAAAVHPASGPNPEAAADAELGELLGEAGDGGEIRIPNRRSLQAAIGEGQWAALELPERPLQLTPSGLEALLERKGLAPTSIGYSPVGPNQRWMWQTLVNALTFEPNFAREVLAGRRKPGSGKALATYVIDCVVSVLAAPLVALVSFPLEAVAALIGRGGEMRVRVAPAGSAGQESSRSVAASSADEPS
jgi:hypothetical protein